MIGNYLWYQVARSIGPERLRRFIDRHGRWLTMDWQDVEKVQRLFDRHGAGIVFTARMLPAVRTFISIPAGIVAHAAREIPALVERSGRRSGAGRSPRSASASAASSGSSRR